MKQVCKQHLEILEEIEETRQQMIQVGLTQGFLCPNTITLSQKLDNLILKCQQIMMPNLSSLTPSEKTSLEAVTI